MVEQFQNLLAFFGVTGVPQNFAELVPWRHRPHDVAVEVVPCGA